MAGTLDRPRPAHSRAEISHFAKVRNAEAEYARKLRQVARHVGEFIRGLFPRGEAAHPDALTQLQAGLSGYAETLTPWAEAVGRRMIVDVAQRDERAWSRLGDRMARALHDEVIKTPLGEIVRGRLETQVMLIKSIPLEAAARVQSIAMQQYYAPGARTDLFDEIMRSGEVTKNRATLIARTETGRTATEFTRARAERVGSTGYIWRTAQDRDVRRRHKELNGTFHKWDEPPVASERGQKVQRYHAGSGPNCRCWAEPIVPDFIE